MLLAELAALARQAEKDAARIFALTFAVAACAAVAVGFATVAAWLMISDAAGPVVASASVAAFYAVAALGLGLAFFRPGSAKRPAADEEERLSDAEAIARVVEAFMTGFRTGRGDGGRP